jgi:hypothetical protein
MRSRRLLPRARHYATASPCSRTGCGHPSALPPPPRQARDSRQLGLEIERTLDSLNAAGDSEWTLLDLGPGAEGPCCGIELLLNLSLEWDYFTDLKEYLRDQSVVEKVSERDPGMAFDHALDPHVLRWLVVKVEPGAMQLGKEAMRVAVAARVAVWVQKRNEKKKVKIEAKESEPLLFDQYGHHLDIHPETKKRNKR